MGEGPTTGVEAMTNYVVVLYGDHGGELDREEVEGTKIGDAIAEIAIRCEFRHGDRIVVEEIAA
jgi:hypothetical protein